MKNAAKATKSNPLSLTLPIQSQGYPIELCEGDDADGMIMVIDGELMIVPRRKFALVYNGRKNTTMIRGA